MKRILLSLSAIMLGTTLFAQEIKTEITLKDRDRGTEFVVIEITADQLIDSISPIQVDDIDRYSTTHSTSMSIIAGVSTYSVTYGFNIRPTRVGTYSIKAPAVYIDGKSYYGEDIQFEIYDVVEKSEMSETELASNFWDKYTGTDSYRITFNGKHGMIEKRKGNTWEAVRVLKERECKKLLKKWID